MRYIFGKGWVYQDEADDGTQGGAGGAAEKTDVVDDDGGADAGADGKAVGDVGADAKGVGAAAGKDTAPKDMQAAIDAGLGYKKGPNGEPLEPLTGKVKEAPKADEKKAAEEKHANGTPKKNEKGEPLDDKGQVVKQAPPKVKTAAELDLKPEEKKILGAKAQQRFGEIITTVKQHEATIGALSTENKGLKEARDTILGVMEETHTTQDQLAGYLEFNALLHSEDPKDLEKALGFVEEQRAALYKALGREPKGGGIDLLADFADLKKQVDDEEITREAALEIAKGRRERAERNANAQRQQQQQQRQTQTQAQLKQASETALSDIEKWTAGLAKSDLDYKAKEDKLLLKLPDVMKNYTPDKWLSTLKLLYDGIEITKAAAPAGGSKGPLRPSGARPGAKAPTDMLQAINQGLGYAGAEKG